MLLLAFLVIIASILISKLISASAVWKCRSIKETLIYFVKFAVTYPIICAKLHKRRTANGRRWDFKNYTKNMLPQMEDWKKECPRAPVTENQMDAIQFVGMDKIGNLLFVTLTHQRQCTQVWLVVQFGGHVYTLPEHPQTVKKKCVNEKRVFVGEGLRFEVREPCRKWRVWINTTVRKGVISSSNEMEETNLVHLKLHGWWAANTELCDTNIDSDASLLAKSIARNSCNSGLLQIVTKLDMNMTSQWGHLIGEMKIGDDAALTSEISMHCLKSRIYADIPWNAFTKLNAHVACLENGMYILLGSVDIMDTLKSFEYGYAFWPDGHFTPITDTNLVYDAYSKGSRETSLVPFCSDGKQNILMLKKTDFAVPLSISEDSDSGKACLQFGKVKCNGRDGYGIHLTWSSHCCANTDKFLAGTIQEFSPEKHGYTSEEASLLVLPLCHRAAKFSELTGGKGSNLARLCELQGEFIVPAGFCVTTAAYISYVAENPDLKRLIEKLQFYGRLSDDELQSTCSLIEDLMSKSKISWKLKSAIEFELRRCFGGAGVDANVAVRSSAVGEDSSDLSTAGQLETYLNRRGLENICEAVRLCWASQFRLPSIHYRKQHGQPLTDPVAVVVQGMVEPDVSGVLFTADPVDGNPLKIVINAHTGLGELVVSGSVTPDTITLRRSYFKRTVTWEKDVLGDNHNGMCCLDKDLAVKLADIGLMIEHAFDGNPQDIEWAIKDGNIYLLQARDITSLDVENQYDLMHEFDDSIKNEDDLYTTANAGEVMRDPQTPLSLSTQTTATDMNIQAMMASRGVIKRISPFCRIGIHSHCNRALFNMLGTLYREAGHLENTRVPEICFMGRPLNMPSAKKAAVERYGVPPLAVSVYRFLRTVQSVFITAPEVHKNAARFANYQVPINGTNDGKALYDEIGKRLEDLAEGWQPHLLNSMASSFGYNLVAAVLLPRDPKIDLTPDHFSDIATLFSSCQNVISADVPTALKEICDAIFSMGHASLFRQMPLDEAIDWLNASGSGEAGAMFRRFLEVHGHRSIDEMDIGSPSWKFDPRPIIQTIQQMLSDETWLWTKKKELSVDEAIGKLKSPTNIIQRFLLKKMVPFARKTVVEREHSKNLAIKVTDGLRNAYRQLGKIMAEQGYLPDKELIFYLTHTEIGDLLENRPAKLVAKAVRRRKLMKVLKTFRYPEIIIGVPQPIQDDTISAITSSTVTVTGTPVSEGIAEGVVRVARRLEEAKDIQPGEILVATSTDIGWSPYFPMLAGVVTELGGLLSHGAVVAREYGLPCIVSAQNATSVFTTGDLARLDAGKGTLQKL